MFKPEPNRSFVHGMPNYTDRMRENIVKPNRRAMEKPVEPIRVGPGLNKGYTSAPSGGVH
mgnify:CR=1 FL=1